MRTLALVLATGTLGCLGIYLFATAPPALGEREATAHRIPIATVFELVAHENAVARALYTEQIVQAGMARGLRFSEDWREPAERAGPLPALYLRETGALLAQSPVELRLFLGSDRPINRANRFTGAQAAAFARVRETGAPVLAFADDTQLHTALFPDIAIARACADCHNDNADSPEHGWRVGDIMGATTWSYPRDSVTPEELVQILAALRGALHEAYAQYVDHLSELPDPPAIGDRWPREGYFLPSPEAFADEHARLASSATLATLLRTAGAP